MGPECHRSLSHIEKRAQPRRNRSRYRSAVACSGTYRNLYIRNLFVPLNLQGTKLPLRLKTSSAFREHKPLRGPRGGSGDFPTWPQGNVRSSAVNHATFFGGNFLAVVRLMLGHQVLSSPLCSDMGAILLLSSMCFRNNSFQVVDVTKGHGFR